MGLAIVDVEVERALARKQSPRVLKARTKERQVVLKRIAVAALSEDLGRVAPTLKAGPVSPSPATVASVWRACGRPVLNGGSM